MNSKYEAGNTGYYISKQEYDMVSKVNNIISKGNNAEVKMQKDGSYTVYDVNKKLA